MPPGAFRRFVDALRANFGNGVVVSTRALSNAAGTTNIFQPSLTRPCLVSYNVRIAHGSATSDTEGRAELRFGPTSPPTQFVVRGGAGYNLQGVLNALNWRHEPNLTALIPKGWYCCIVPVTVAGTPTFTMLADQYEAPL